MVTIFQSIMMVYLHIATAFFWFDLCCKALLSFGVLYVTLVYFLQVINNPCVERTQDGQTVAGVDYLEDDIQDHIYQAVLRQSYQTFRVHNFLVNNLTPTFFVFDDAKNSSRKLNR